MEIEQILADAIEKEASDILIVAGCNMAFKINNDVKEQAGQMLMPVDTERLIKGIYQLANRDMRKISMSGDDDFSFGLQRIGRFRCNAFKQRGTYAAVLRVVPFELPDAARLGIPQAVLNLSQKRRGMVFGWAATAR